MKSLISGACVGIAAVVCFDIGFQFRGCYYASNAARIAECSALCQSRGFSKYGVTQFSNECACVP